MADTDESGDAAQAFEELTEEVSALKHQVEELADAMRLRPIPDYTPSLAEIAMRLEVFADLLAKIEARPALERSPAAFAEAISRAGADAASRATGELAQVRRDMEQATGALRELIGVARTKDRQRRWLLATGVGAFVLGLAAYAFMVR